MVAGTRLDSYTSMTTPASPGICRFKQEQQRRSAEYTSFTQADSERVMKYLSTVVGTKLIHIQF